MKTRRRNGFKQRTVKMSMKGGGKKRFTKKVDGEEGIYEGEFNDKGERHGKGIMHYTVDDVFYEGDWKNDKMDGNGKFKFTDGENSQSYEGEFKNNEFHGYGIYTDIDRNKRFTFTYRGYFVNSNRHGMGFNTTTNRMGDGTIYGNYENEVLVKGTGTRCFNDDVKEEGDFEYNELVKGKKNYWNGLIEEGDFENGEIINGKTTYPDGTVYVGTYNKQGVPDGVGTLVGKFKYHGEYQNGKMSGFGMIAYPDGRVYEGQFINDENHGMGKLTLPNGTTKTGRFYHNQPSPNVVVLNAAQNSILTELGLGTTAGRVFSKRGSRRK